MSSTIMQSSTQPDTGILNQISNAVKQAAGMFSTNNSETATASAKVLTTYELLEIILTHLTIRDLLKAQLVNSAFHDVIQRSNKLDHFDHWHNSRCRYPQSPFQHKIGFTAGAIVFAAGGIEPSNTFRADGVLALKFIMPDAEYERWDNDYQCLPMPGGSKGLWRRTRVWEADKAVNVKVCKPRSVGSTKFSSEETFAAGCTLGELHDWLLGEWNEVVPEPVRGWDEVWPDFPAPAETQLWSNGGQVQKHRRIRNGRARR